MITHVILVSCMDAVSGAGGQVPRNPFKWEKGGHRIRKVVKSLSTPTAVLLVVWMFCSLMGARCCLACVVTGVPISLYQVLLLLGSMLSNCTCTQIV